MTSSTQEKSFSSESDLALTSSAKTPARLRALLPSTPKQMLLYSPKADFRTTLLSWPLLSALAILSAHAECAAKSPTVLCKTTGTSLQFEVINPLIKTPQEGLGHVKIHCKNYSNSPQQLALAIHLKKKDKLILKKGQDSRITLQIFADEHYRHPLGHESPARTALEAQATIEQHADSVFHLPFFAQLVFPRMPEAGEHVEAAEFELSYQATPIAAPAMQQIQFRPDRESPSGRNNTTAP